MAVDPDSIKVPADNHSKKQLKKFNAAIERNALCIENNTTQKSTAAAPDWITKSGPQQQTDRTDIAIEDSLVALADEATAGRSSQFPGGGFPGMGPG